MRSNKSILPIVALAVLLGTAGCAPSGSPRASSWVGRWVHHHGNVTASVTIQSNGSLRFTDVPRDAVHPPTPGPSNLDWGDLTDAKGSWKITDEQQADLPTIDIWATDDESTSSGFTMQMQTRNGASEVFIFLNHVHDSRLAFEPAAG